VRDPAAFLFDEPLSNLDAQLRSQMRLEIKKLHQRLGTTIVFVTHDQVEAMTMADRIVVMRDGRILQVGTPMALYERPVDVFTARFIGSPTMNLLPGRLESDGDRPVVVLDGTGARVALPPEAAAGASGAEVLLGVRPHDLAIGRPETGGGLTLAGAAAVVEPLGAETLVHLEIDGTPVIGTAPGKSPPAVGTPVVLRAPVESLYLFDARTEGALWRP
jgi:multiple sugar transport system ATP-binding protein